MYESVYRLSGATEKKTKSPLKIFSRRYDNIKIDLLEIGMKLFVPEFLRRTKKEREFAVKISSPLTKKLPNVWQRC
jgi:hypothetical protein